MPDAVFAQLKPQAVWAHFQTLCRIPRPSKQEAALRTHLMQWAESLRLAYEVDAVGNLLIRKPASPGAEQAPGVILQGHLDMVCQAQHGVAHDFTRDPIRPVLTDDGWLQAVDTTLGADNGLGVALAMAVLSEPNLVHGPIEVLLTVDEEAGMGGVKGLREDWLQGRYLINLDTEEWGEFYLGCAGGLDVNVDRPGQPKALPSHALKAQLSVRGLRGGHSGVNIHEERGNAIKWLVRCLVRLDREFDIRLISLQGGTARNALPREAFATFSFQADQRSNIEAALQAMLDTLRSESADIEPKLQVLWDLNSGHVEDGTSALSDIEQRTWLHTLHASPHGVKKQSLSVKGVVETSNNLGMVNLNAEHGHCNYLVRSLRDSAAQALADEMVSLWALSGTTAHCDGHYPGWAPQSGSPLLQLCQDVFKTQFHQDATVQVIHAGLECGLLSAKYPHLDIISFGPTIRGAHAPGERVKVDTVGPCWDLLTALLSRLSQLPT